MSPIFKKIGLLVFVFACFALIYPSADALSNEIKWYSYDEGIKLYKKQGKKVFVTFYADWCTYCKVMDKKTFKDPTVVDFLNQNFVPIKVNSDKERKTARSFRVRGLPDSWFLSEEGEVIGHRAGYIPPDTMIKMLKFIHTDSYKNMSYQNFVDKEK